MSKPLFAAILEAVSAELGPRLAFDRAPDVDGLRHGIVVKLAFDKELHKPDKQQKTTDDFDRLHVRRVPITKACVNPYYGREIPNAKALGLDPNTVYWLLRDPSELRKAAPTFHNIPLLSKHVPHTADDHDGDIMVGTVGSEAVYEHPYLYNSLAIWSREGLHYAEGDQKELSSAYGYDADMTPGVYEGQRYDGVMRNMKGNHVCMVKRGRAGSDIALDEELNPTNEETVTMSKKIQSLRAGVALGAVRAHLASGKVKLAQDAAIPDVSPLFTPIKVGKFKAAIPSIVKGVEKALKGKLAQDADLAGVVDGVQKLMASIEGDKTVADAEVDAEVDPNLESPTDGELDPDAPVMDGSCEAIAAYLKEKGVPDDIIAGMPGMAPEGEDEGPTDEMAARLAAGKKKPGAVDDKTVDDKGGKKDDDKVTVGAMDEALKKQAAQLRADARGVQEALKHVKPIVGEIEMAFDTAEGVYHQAFKMIGKPDVAKTVKGSDVLKTMWDLVPPPGRQQQTAIAQDEATGDDFATMFPVASKRNVVAGK